jgi:Domain of unknown function (DUF4282)
MWDFFSFRLMISTGLIKIMYPIGALAILIAPMTYLFIVPKTGASTAALSTLPWEMILLSVIVGQVMWRVFCEQLILLFSIHDSLKKSEARAAGK